MTDTTTTALRLLASQLLDDGYGKHFLAPMEQAAARIETLEHALRQVSGAANSHPSNPIGHWVEHGPCAETLAELQGALA